MVYSVFLLSFNLLVDIAYSWVDPRIDLAQESN
jgi:ABC-type dipeptide/oligopeptide/nickel transport system permease component